MPIREMERRTAGGHRRLAARVRPARRLPVARRLRAFAGHAAGAEFATPGDGFTDGITRCGYLTGELTR
ncbi:hypothetical protein DV26_25855 [Amycolatopsis mediterranei]|nr:hypothetical protein DV26_25855 [Amycolatopsis mediterranei]